MTAALATRGHRTTSKRTDRAGGPQLRVLNQQAIRQRARRRNALLALFLVVLMGFFVVAFVHAQLVAGQQELDVLRAEIARAETERARLSRAVEEASSPEVVVERAQQLGMVRAAEPVYLGATAPAGEVVPVLLPPIEEVVEETTELEELASVLPTVERGSGDVAAPEPTVVTPDAGADAGSAQVAAADEVLRAGPGNPVTVPIEAATGGASAPDGVAGQGVTVSGSGIAGAEVGPTTARPVDASEGAPTSIAGTHAVAGGTGG